jgi:hypothetical protein
MSELRPTLDLEDLEYLSASHRQTSEDIYGAAFVLGAYVESRWWRIREYLQQPLRLPTSLDRTMNLHPQVYQHMVIMMGTSQQIPVRD